jgi:hypothetical protein
VFHNRASLLIDEAAFLSSPLACRLVKKFECGGAGSLLAASALARSAYSRAKGRPQTHLSLKRSIKMIRESRALFVSEQRTCF